MQKGPRVSFVGENSKCLFQKVSVADEIKFSGEERWALAFFTFGTDTRVSSI